MGLHQAESVKLAASGRKSKRWINDVRSEAKRQIVKRSDRDEAMTSHLKDYHRANQTQITCIDVTSTHKRRRRRRSAKMAQDRSRTHDTKIIGCLAAVCFGQLLLVCQAINFAEAIGCPYPSVGSNCQVNIVAQAPAVPLLASDYVADEYATLKPDTQAAYKCDQGYELLGQETATCLASGRWSGPAPSCVTNVAPGKPTNQSSTQKGGDSRNANDGRLTNQHDGRHCSETRVDQSPWWQIDLLQVYEVRAVRLLGRACCNPQLALHDVEIRVGNSSTLQGNRLCAWHPGNLDEGQPKDFQCAHPINGRFVSIQMVGIEASLSLCEVMVFSTKEFPPDRCSIQATLAPTTASNKPQAITTTSATPSQTGSQVDTNQLVVFNRTCYEMQTANGGSFLVADTYCKARGGTLVHSVTNLTQTFMSLELERMKSKLKSKMVWLGAKRENSSPNAAGPVTSGSSSALIGSDGFMKSLAASLHDNPDRLFSAERGLSFSSEQSPVHSLTRRSLYLSSSGAGGAMSRGSQTYGLPTMQQATNRTVEHPQRSLIVSQPNQVASFFTPPVPISPSVAPVISQPIAAAPSSAPVQSPATFTATHIHRSLRPPALASTTPSPPPPSSSLQTNWAQASSPLSTVQTMSSSNWRWVGDAASDSLLSPINNFLWAEDQPNNYNNQQDCIVLDGAKRWLWNDVTCELDYLPWVCQYRPSTCGSPNRHENSTILELPTTGETASNGVSISEPSYQFGKTITYACPVGHKLDGPRQRRCQYDGTWSGQAPRCQYVNCGPLTQQTIENGRLVYLNQSQTTYGSQVKYVCFEDYVLVGQDLRQCQEDGKWSGKPPFCAYKWCPVLPQIPNGFMNVSSYSENSIATYKCNSGYKLIGNDTRQCLLGGKWTNQEPFCQYVDCGQPKQIPNGKYQLVNSTTNYLSIVSYSCNEDYTLDGGSSKLVCSHNNRWTGKEPQCSLINCGQPQTNPGSSLLGQSFTVHSSIEYKCDPGFKEVAGNSQRTCGLDGQWTGQPISCKYVDCGRVPGILKGEVSYINGTTYLASQVSYECTAGNRLSGHRVRFCGPDGRWTGTSPKCEEVRCEAPQMPLNGSAIYIGNDRSFKEQSFSVGVTVQYECDYGHVVKGSWSSRLCQANGEWSGEPPVCKFVDCGQPPQIENGNLVLKHPPAGSVGSASLIESQRRSDSLASGTFTYYGTIAHYSCDTNYKLLGPSQRECLDNGLWRRPLPSCEPVQCPKPDHFDEYTLVSLLPKMMDQQDTPAQQLKSNAIKLIANNQWLDKQLESRTFGVGDKLYYSCSPGYELYGGPEIRSCTQYGQWSGSSTPRCRLIDCGKPSSIGQEGRFYLLNETTHFNSFVEYSCVRPLKLIEVKIRQSGSLIETLNVAQAGVTTILTSLPIGVKVCANNGQWMPNDQQPRCVSPSMESTGGSFEGQDNTLDSSTRVQVLSDLVAEQRPHDKLDPLDVTSGRQTQVQASSLLAQVMIAMCLLVMLGLIVLTLICIRSGKRPKQTANGHHGQRGHQAGGSGLPNAHQTTGAMQLASSVSAAAKLQHQQAMMMQQPPAVYLNNAAGGQKVFAASMMSQPYGDGPNSLLNGAPAGHQNNGTRNPMFGFDCQVAESMGMAVNGGPMKGANGSSAMMMDSYSRLSIESESQLDQQRHQSQSAKTIRHNPNGLVTFVSPTQQQQQHGAAVRPPPTSQQPHQVSPQSISSSMSISSSSSPTSNSSSAHHTTATGLSATDSNSSSSTSSHRLGGYQAAQPLAFNSTSNASQPPSLPAHPPPPHRVQQHAKQLLKQQHQLQLIHRQQQQQQPSLGQQSANNNHHYMEPNL